MTRAERRRLQKKQNRKDPIYNISEKRLDKIRQDERENAVNDAFILLMSIPIRVLKKNYGWGNKKKLPDFAELLCDAYQEFVESGRDLEAEVDFVYEQTGIKFEKNTV